MLAKTFKLNNLVPTTLGNPVTENEIDNNHESKHQNLKARKAPGNDPLDKRCLKGLPGKDVKYLAAVMSQGVKCVTKVLLQQTQNEQHTQYVKYSSNSSGNTHIYI